MKRDKRAFAVLATDVAILTVDEKDVKALLAPAKSVNFRGMPALPGGLVGLTEKTEDAAKRIASGYLLSLDFYTEQLFTFDDPMRDPAGRVVSVAYLMLIPWNRAKSIIKADASWEPVKSLPKLGYDHGEIVKLAVKRLRSRITYTNIVFSLMPKEFTLSELQKVYEIVLDQSLDKRNFRKKIISLNLLRKLAKKRGGEANRPAQLYAFKDSELIRVGIL